MATYNASQLQSINGNSFSNAQKKKRRVALQKPKFLPKRIILVRHGESEGNVDEEVLEYVPNYKIKLSKKGIHQAQEVGLKLKEVLASDQNGGDECKNIWKVLFYVSPSSRTRETMEGMMICGGEETFMKDRVIGVKEECRLREQHFGNFQEMEKRKKIKRMRMRYGKFFYRVPDGESSADVYDRVSNFVESLWRDMEMNKLKNNGLHPSDELNLIVVSHGLTILLFLMKWFNWSVDEFEGLTNPKNCEHRVLQLGPNGAYSLAIHHSTEQLKEWGLSQEMIEDQKLRAFGPDFHTNAKRIKYFDSFDQRQETLDHNVEDGDGKDL